MMFKNLSALLVLSAGLTVGCGSHKSNSTPSIKGGSLANSQGILKESTVAFTSAYAARGGSSFCTGTLIDNRFVLTAAHCLANESGSAFSQSADQILVNFGTQVGSRESVLKRVKVQAFHRFYDSVATVGRAAGVPNDIALVLLEDVAPSFAKPVEIASGNELVRPGSSVILAGFGTTRNRNVNDTGTLRYTEQTVSRVDAAVKRLTTGSGIEASGACAGDSGGPVYIRSRDAQGNMKLVLQGVLSTGAESQNGSCIGTNNYTDPAAYKEWIEATKAVLLAAEQRGLSSVRP